jgi:hypothetical protein
VLVRSKCVASKCRRSCTEEKEMKRNHPFQATSSPKLADSSEKERQEKWKKREEERAEEETGAEAEAEARSRSRKKTERPTNVRIAKRKGSRQRPGVLRQGRQWAVASSKACCVNLSHSKEKEQRAKSVKQRTTTTKKVEPVPFSPERGEGERQNVVQ